MRDRQSLSSLGEKPCDDFEDLFQPNSWCTVICRLCDHLALNSASDVRQHCKLHSIKKEANADYDDFFGSEDADDYKPDGSNTLDTEPIFAKTVMPSENNSLQSLECFPCQDCNVSYFSAAELASHVVQSHSNLVKQPKKRGRKKRVSSPIEEKQVDLPNADNRELCIINSDILPLTAAQSLLTIEQSTDMEEVEDVLTPKMHCKICNEKFEQLKNLAEHIVEMHGHTPPFNQLLNLTDESFHSDDFETKLELEESEAETVATDNKLLKMEEKWLDVVKSYRYLKSDKTGGSTCNICKKTYWSESYLKHVHMVMSHPDKDYSVNCELCGKKFKNNHLLNYHRYRSHKDIRKIKNYPTEVDTRIRNNTQRKKRKDKPPKVSNSSGKKYPSYSEVPLICSYCGFSTHYRASHDLHVRVKHESHLEENKKKKYHCTYCEYATFSKPNYNRHVFTKHEYKMGINTDKAMICPHCSFTTPDKNSYNDHVRHVHEGVPRKKRPPRVRRH